MTTHPLDVTCLTDQELLTEVQRFAQLERQTTAALIALLMELDARRLYLGEGHPSLFAYCTQTLHLSEHATYLRIAAARAARRFPVIVTLLAEGDIHLTAIAKVASVLTPTNHVEVLKEASHKSKHEIEVIVARLKPQPDVPATVRKLPEPKPRAGTVSLAVERENDQPRIDLAPSALSDQPRSQLTTPDVQPPPARPSIVTPLAPERYKVQFTVSRETHDKLRRAQDLLRHTIPSGDPAQVFDQALTVLLEHLEKTKLAATKHPRDTVRAMRFDSRHIPANVRRAVWHRDGGRCAFVGTAGRCTETGFLEFHHVLPYAAGGQAVLGNIQLRCKAHNVFEAEQFFGPHDTPLFCEECRDPAAPVGLDRGK